MKLCGSFSPSGAVAALLILASAVSIRSVQAAEKKFTLSELNKTFTLDENDFVKPTNLDKNYKFFLIMLESEIQTIKRKGTKATKEELVIKQDLVNDQIAVLELMDIIGKITKTAYTGIIYLGAELQIPLLDKLFDMMSKSVDFDTNAQISFGITIGTTESALTNVTEGAEFGFASLVGLSLNAHGRRPKDVVDATGSGGNQKFLGVAAIFPCGKNSEPIRLGDLQGWYYGLGAEIPTGNVANKNLGSIEFGFYALPSYLDRGFIRACMIRGLYAWNYHRGGNSAQFEGLHFATLANTDGSRPRSPFVNTANFASSVHAPEQQRAFWRDLTAPHQALVKKHLEIISGKAVDLTPIEAQGPLPVPTISPKAATPAPSPAPQN